MSNENPISRRELSKRVGTIAAASALAGIAIPAVHAAENSTIQVALIGCGGRGTGAAVDALRAKGAQIKLVALGDVFRDRLDDSYARLGAGGLGERVDVPPERQFVGFDAYRKAIDCLKTGDVAIFATPLAFRATHFQYAIEKGVHAFMEKPLSADGAQSRQLLKLAEQASAKNLKVGVGLMSRHARNLQELQKRVADGAIGDIILMRGYRMHGPVATFASTPKPPDVSELEFQIRRFHSFLWASGGCFSDFNIHTIDQLCWMKNDWPTKAMGVGGRHFKHAADGTPFVDQNFDSYGIEYTFADGTKMTFDGRVIEDAQKAFHSFAHGSKGCAVVAASGEFRGPTTIFKGLSEQSEKLWQSSDGSNPYQNEWDALIDAIVHDKPHNEVKRGVEASVVTSMGRMAAHTGREVTFVQMLSSDHEFAPDVDTMTPDSPAPLKADERGMYPRPEPGRKKLEY